MSGPLDPERVPPPFYPLPRPDQEIVVADRHLFVVLSNSAPGQDDEFNRWYDNTHIPQVLKIPGWNSVQRYRLHPARLNDQVAPGPHQYMALWDIEGDPAAAFAAHDEFAGRGEIDFTSAIDLSSGTAWTFSPIGDRHSG
ncbi:DUF4286 family protein [Streptomyces fuscichromogenes]|uniref:EthD domain-containing protein n=1 Tax=Streptomyces fuscichromogenes TaxID=1324013 RepID=A0A917XGC4_9ACTN|nr:DUF4286 family protein [Streptomyces fuscichromogenes]GGN23002.1 hypothetical protein GCM10011578_055000 [Streptomyces fuscichromogenes]